MVTPDRYHFVYWRSDDEKGYIKKPIKYGDILGYFDDTWRSATGVWRDFKLYGLPHGAGSLNERPMVVQAIRIVEEENNFFKWCSGKERELKRKHGGS